MTLSAEVLVVLPSLADFAAASVVAEASWTDT